MPASGQPIGHKLSCWLAAVRTHYIVVLVFTLVVYFPRLFLSYFVFFVAQFLRLVARLIGVAGGRSVNNKRILMITDYMPPQTHGIAIRCHAYVKEMRAQGHEVIVFATAYEASKETSFDHPNIPSVVNPFNLNNRIGYTPGVKLAWFLGANSWDVVHVVFPSLLSLFVLPLCAWRRIPVYCSHHVEMDMFGSTNVASGLVCQFGLFMYNVIGKWPAVKWGTLNSAPTLCFAKDHIGKQHAERLRAVPSGTHDVFKPQPSTPDERQEVRKARFKVTDEKTRVVLMVQRLSSEKGTERVFPAFVPKEKGGEGVQGVLAIAGDGPARAALMAEAEQRGVKVIFLGNVPHDELPKLYRAADCFVTMSLSETFGLTCLEAQMCGCPAVMPFCDVFDEIWNDKVPKDWRYDINDIKQFASAIAAAQSGRSFLTKNPINMTWADAAKNLLKQYDECIAFNQEKKDGFRELVTRFDHLIRIAIGFAFAYVVLRRYVMVLKSFGTAVSWM